MGAVEEWPLARLFLLGTRVLIDGLHDRMASRGWPQVRSGYGFVLLGIRHQALTVTELAALLGVSKQAASKLVALMHQDGLVDVTPHPEDSRSRLIEITPLGREFLDAAEDIHRELEAEWAAEIGKDRLEAIRADLTALVVRNGESPPLRPIA